MQGGIMDLGLKDKTIVVTGGGAGIGAAISLTLAEEGAVPVILTRRAPDADFLTRLVALQPAAGWVQADLAQDADCVRAVAEVKAKWGPVYGLVNNAGRNDGVGLEAGPAAFRASLDQNLLHYYTLLHLLQDDIKASRGAVVRRRGSLCAALPHRRAGHRLRFSRVLSIQVLWSARGCALCASRSR